MLYIQLLNDVTYFLFIDGFLRVTGHHGPQRIEDVVDWPMVVQRYHSMQGIESENSEMGDNDNGSLQME